jgi:four helix bundle protein
LNLLSKFQKKIPQKDQFSLAEQLRRAALAISTNIAEGSGRKSIKEAGYFYNIAKGSVYEVISLIIITKRRRYCSKEEFNKVYELSDEIARMLSGLMKKE